jgi:hypothetical protein
MTRTAKRRGRWTIAALCALSLAAAAPIAATAATRPDDRPGLRTPSGVSTLTATRPDDRDGIRAPGAASDVLQPVAAASAAFSWGDAGIGAVAALGAIALLGTAAVGIRRRGRTPSSFSTITRERSV